MTATTAVLAGRLAAEARMIDRGRLRGVQRVDTDPVTGRDTRPVPDRYRRPGRGDRC